MDQRPIGVFDSGLGGLTAVAELIRLLPGEEIVYFGDTGRVPYGSRSRDTIIKYARQDMAFLRTFDLKAVVIACGTVSTTAIDVLAAENDIPVLGVVEPSARRAAQATRNGRIGLIGTQASIRSGAYEKYIEAESPGVQVLAKACPLFVPLVENGRIHPGDAVIETVCAEYLQPLKDAGVDTLVMGCTHYPLLETVIGNYMGPGVTLVNAGAEGARAAAKLLEKTESLAERRAGGTCRYFVSDSVQDFSRLASLFLRRDVSEAVTQIDIVQY